MIRVLNQIKSSIKEIQVQDIESHELDKLLFAYKSTGGKGYCILSKISTLTSSGFKNIYAFFPLNSSDSYPRYVRDSLRQSVEGCAKDREVYAFNTMEELISAMYHKTF